MRALWLAVAVGAASVGGLVGGCELFTGSTDGYVAAEAGDDAGPEVDGACPADAAFCIALECLSTAECPASDDAAPLICCLGEVSSKTIGSSCQNGCTLGVQACSTNTECGGASCILQQCQGATPITFRACGLLPDCNEITGSSPDAGKPGPADAGNPDASSPDSGSSDAGTTDASDAQGFDAAG